MRTINLREISRALYFLKFNQNPRKFVRLYFLIILFVYLTDSSMNVNNIVKLLNFEIY